MHEFNWTDFETKSLQLTTKSLTVTNFIGAIMAWPFNATPFQSSSIIESSHLVTQNPFLFAISSNGFFFFLFFGWHDHHDDIQLESWNLFTCQKMKCAQNVSSKMHGYGIDDAVNGWYAFGILLTKSFELHSMDPWNWHWIDCFASLSLVYVTIFVALILLLLLFSFCIRDVKSPFIHITFNRM